MSRPRKITDEKLTRLIAVAQVRLTAEAIIAAVPVNKRLAPELGVTPAYLHNIMHRLMTLMRIDQHVSHETLRRVLFNDKEFAQLTDRLKRPKVNVMTLPADANEAHL